MIVGAAFSGEALAGLRDFVFTLQGNRYHGSIVGRNRVDGLTGATKNGHGATLGVEYNLKGHPLQASATFGWTKQNVSYGPPAENVQGNREIKLYLLDIPVMYNFHLLKTERFGRMFPRLILSSGAFITFVLRQQISDSVLISPDVSKLAMGPFLRAAYYPYPFKYLRPGIFLEFYRSFVPKVYDDPLFRQNGIAGQLGIMNFGIAVRM